MILNCHYYVLSLGMEASVLFEAFRDQLVEIRNQGFPVTQLTDFSGNRIVVGPCAEGRRGALPTTTNRTRWGWSSSGVNCSCRHLRR